MVFSCVTAVMRLDLSVTDATFKQHATMIQTRETVINVSDLDQLVRGVSTLNQMELLSTLD